MGIRIRKFGEFLHVESGIWENLTCGIRNPGLWNLEYSSKNLELIPLTIGIQNPCSTDKELQSGINGLESGILHFLTWSDFIKYPPYKFTSTV